MYDIRIVHVNASGELRKNIYEKVQHSIPVELKKEYSYSEKGYFEIPLFEDSKEYQYVVDLAKKMNLTCEISEKTIYTPKEEENCEYFYMWLSEPMELEAVHLEDYNTKFIRNCSKCEAGRQLLGDALVDRKLIKNKPILQLTDSLITVSKSVKWLVEENGLTGFNFEHLLKDYKGREMDEYFCVEPQNDNILPPMHENTWFREWREKECEHKQYWVISNVKYARKSLQNAKDFNFSYEFSYGLNPNRFLIVSGKLRKVFKEHKIRVGFQPVNTID